MCIGNSVKSWLWHRIDLNQQWMKDDFSVSDTRGSIEKTRVLPIGVEPHSRPQSLLVAWERGPGGSGGTGFEGTRMSRTYEHLVTSPDALPLSYRRLVLFFSLSLFTKAVQSDNLQTALPASSVNLSGWSNSDTELVTYWRSK